MMLVISHGERSEKGFTMKKKLGNLFFNLNFAVGTAKKLKKRSALPLYCRVEVWSVIRHIDGNGEHLDCTPKFNNF
jgi:hypothetical protein